MSADGFVKESAAVPAGFFEAEAAGLDWLASAHGARVARVLAVAPGRIVLERIASAPPDAEAAAAFGRALADTHAAGADAFGAPPTGWHGPVFIGRRRQSADPSPAWGGFYARQRVLPFVAPAVDAGNLTLREARIVEDACAVIAAGAFDDADERPARVHGDLWNGNMLWSPDGAVLIDPAAHGGSAETDLAMLGLFGLPFLDVVLAAYDEHAPLRAGWRERVPVHQLHPLAVHAAGHGRAYGRALADAAGRTLALAR